MNKYIGVSTRLEVEDYEQLKEYAAKHDLSMSQIMRKAIKSFLEIERKRDSIQIFNTYV